MQVTRATFIPLLAAANSDRMDPSAVRDEYTSDLSVVYTFGPQFGRRVVTHADLEQMHMPPPALRRSAFEHLEVLSSRAEFHGQPPALMLSFEGLESSLLLASDFWNRLKGAVPGELVVGVPARDVVIVTGSQSAVGLEKARRCVERVFMAGDEYPLSRNLLVRRGSGWEPFDRAARPASRPGANHHHGHSQPPRQYQEHPSWPEQRVQVTPMRPPADRIPHRPPMRPAQPAAAMPTPRPGLTASGAPLPFPAQPGHTGAVPRQRPVAPPRPAPTPAEIAQFSAMPYSSLPYSGIPKPVSYPTSAPQSAVPYSAAPYSAAPYSGAPYSAQYTSRTGARHSQPQETPKPAYRDDLYSTGSHAAPLYPATDSYQSPSVEVAQPNYPESWGWAPEQAPIRSERPMSPRDRFSRP